MSKYTNRPLWLDEAAYPFKSHFFSTDNGRIHYVDEGHGEVLLFVHGTPTWSFLYRNYIKTLSKSYRCIAIDHLGFGLSDKLSDVTGTPEFHSHMLTRFIENLDLQNITLVLHDFGGPIGLGSALCEPNRIAKVVLFNTWLWRTKDDPNAQRINKILHSRLGNFIYLNTNFSPRILLKKAFHNPRLLKRNIHSQYQKPFPDKQSRHGLLKIGKSLFASSDWFEEQWEQIDVLKHKPFLLLWGNKDPFIKMEHFERWAAALPGLDSQIFEAGHFVQEEKFEQSLEKLESWLKRHRSVSS